LTLDGKQIFKDTWGILIPALLKFYEAIKVPVWDNFLKDWVLSNNIWLFILAFIFIFGWPITSRERRKMRNWYFSIWGLMSAIILVLSGI